MFSKISSLLAVAVVSVLGLSTPAQAGIITWEFSVDQSPPTFNSVPANDFHVVFIGTGGSVDNVVLKFDPDPAGSGVASTNGVPGISSNGIDVIWTNNVDTNDAILLTFTALPGIQIAAAWWTMNGVEVQSVPLAMMSLSPIPGPGSLALLGCAGALSRRRRRRKP